MGCAIDCMLKKSFYFHLYCTPKGASYYLFTESLSIVGLDEFLFSEDSNCLALVTNRPVSTPSLYAEIYVEKRGDFVRHWNIRMRFFHIFWVNQTFDHVLLTYGLYQHSLENGNLCQKMGFGAGMVWNFFFFSKTVRKVKDTFRIWRSSWVLQNHIDRTRQSKTCWFFSCSFAGHKYLLAITSKDSGCYRDLHFVNCGTHGHTHTKERD